MPTEPALTVPEGPSPCEGLVGLDTMKVDLEPLAAELLGSSSTFLSAADGSLTSKLTI